VVSGGIGDTRAAKLAPSPRKGWRDMSAPSAILKVLVLRLGLSHQTTICPVSVYKLKQAYRLTGLQAYRLTGLQAYRLTGLQAYRLTGLQAYRLTG
jgi:hypothetical protein